MAIDPFGNGRGPELRDAMTALRVCDSLAAGVSNDGLCVTDDAGRIGFATQRFASLLATGPDDLTGIDLRSLTVPAGAAPPAAFSAADGTPFEWSLRRGDGTTLRTTARVKPIEGPGGGRAGFVVAVTDVTAVYQAERELDRTRQLCEFMAESMPHPVFTSDPDGTDDYYNRAWIAYSGLDAARSTSGGWLSVVHPDDVARARSAWDRAYRDGTPFCQQIRLRRASDGVYRWFESNATPLRDRDGSVLRWVGSAIDVHDLRLATETRSVLDTLGHMVSIRDEDGRIEYVSRSWLDFTGIDLGGHGYGREAFHPDDRDIAEGLTAASLASPGRIMQNELRVRAADGSYHWFLVRAVTLCGASSTARRINTLTNIDELKRAQAAFGYSEQRYRALTDAMPQMIWIVDATGELEYVNERWATYTGLTLKPDMPRKSGSIVHPDDLAILIAKHDARAESDDECELRIRRHDGVYRWHLVRTVPLGDEDDVAAKWIVTATDIEARKSAEAALAHSTAELTRRAHHDALTNLPNRTKVLERLAEIIEQAERERGEIVVLYLDIDHFKAINDTVGHHSGDRLLIETAARISSTLRGEDTASRFGGDEFVVVCASAGAAEAAGIAERLQAAVRVPIELHGKKVTVSSSIGISVYPRDGSNAAELIQKADSALYEAKENGRNTWFIYNHAQSHVPTVPALEFAAELREAIALEQFVVHYQPIVDLDSGRTVGAEALVRWAHPERGLLAPGEFISFAEHHGLIAPIGDLVLRKACEELRRLRLRPSDDFSIAVNVSARQFQKPGFVGTIADAIEAFGLDARRLEIEITESIVMCDTSAVIATLDKLEALGVKLSLDDFGTGYSSLAYIKNFPIHTLKIDRSFVSDIAINFTDQAIAKTIVTLAHSLGMRVIAEGVETHDQLELLRSFGADCIQGYLISKPLAGPAFEDFMAGRSSAVM